MSDPQSPSSTPVPPSSKPGPVARFDEAEAARAAAPSCFSTKSPLDGASLGEVKATAIDEIPAIVGRAREAQRAWAERPVAERIKLLLHAKDRLLDRAQMIAERIHAEVGKPEVEALLGEVLPSADVIVYWAHAIEELTDPVEVELDALSYPKKTGMIYREPRGIVGVIMPYNFPFALPLRTIVPALLAGNAVVFKPSEVAPRAGALVADLFDGLLPHDVLQLVQGGRDAGAALVQSDIDFVAFTGSVEGGRKVARACADRLAPCSLELGGKDAAIVLADANLDRAANGIVWGAMMNAGQNCAAVERVYVVEKVAAQLTEKIVAATKALKTGDEVGPLATEAQRSIVGKHVDAAKSAGAEVLAGGDGEGSAGLFFAPTVLKMESGSDELALMKEETFGPVVPIVTVKDADEAIVRANASRYGLTASIWTKDLRRGAELARKLRAGVVTVNNHAFTGAIPAAPWGGYGDTGYGVTGSPLALDALTRPRFVLVDRNRKKRELWWYPYTPVLKVIALALAVLRSGSSGILAKIGAFFRLIGAMPKRFKA
jgi:acyl-CoA reductase-like NAD-dependent aldehyde dehydrogenase